MFHDSVNMSQNFIHFYDELRPNLISLLTSWSTIERPWTVVLNVLISGN